MSLSRRLPRRVRAGARPEWRLWACALALGLATALIGFPGIEGGLRVLKSRVHAHPASGRVVVVEIDDRSLDALGRWPVPRSAYAQLTRKLFAQGARRVFFDIDFSSPQGPRDDDQFAAEIARHPGRVTLASRVLIAPGSGLGKILSPIPSLRAVADVASISFPFDSLGDVWQLPYALEMGGQSQIGMAAAIADNGSASGPDIGHAPFSLFAIDGAIRPDTIPSVAMIETLRGLNDPGIFDGRDVVVGATTEQVGDMYSVPPNKRIGGVYLQAIGAETLLSGTPRNVGFLPAYIVAAPLALLLLGWRRRRSAILAALVASLAIAAGTVALPGIITVSPVAGIAVLLAVAAFQLVALAKDMLRIRATINQVSGLLNLTALRQLPPRAATRLVVAHVHNFAEATATLPDEAEAALVAQIATRLRLGMTEAELYHGDNGVFAWFSEEEAAAVGGRLDALHAVFRSALAVYGRPLDLSITFGIDDDDGRAIANRLGSALVAAAEAAAEGARWREFDKAKLADTAWKLSMLSELDAAIDDGHLWVAYQPKLDLRSRRIVGAEALVRWTHPEKGAISPIEFVAAAEQHNRIEKLTAHVLERAVLAAATINAHDIAFGIAVNLSARLLDGPGLIEQVRTILERHQLDPALLTLEVTETATLASVRSLDTLHALRTLGVRISIDDYGTGLSTLEYLRKVPAGEIKIDRSFVQAMGGSSSDLLMVNSTIQLAHSLGHSVVAEGVESADVLIRLAELGCDVAQGYHIGRPMTFQDLARRLLAERRCAA